MNRKVRVLSELQPEMPTRRNEQLSYVKPISCMRMRRIWNPVAHREGSYPAHDKDKSNGKVIQLMQPLEVVRQNVRQPTILHSLDQL